MTASSREWFAPLRVRLLGEGAALLCIGCLLVVTVGAHPLEMAAALALGACGGALYWWRMLLPSLRDAMLLADVMIGKGKDEVGSPVLLSPALLYVVAFNIALDGGIVAVLVYVGFAVGRTSSGVSAAITCAVVLIAFGGAALAGAVWTQRWERSASVDRVMERVTRARWRWATSFPKTLDLTLVKHSG